MKSLRLKVISYVAASPTLRPLLPAWGRFKGTVRLQLVTSCFVFRVILPLLLRTRKRPVLFSRYVGLGDILCTFPAALELKKKHPQATFIYSCHSDFAGLPPMGGVADLTAPFSAEGLRKWWAFLFAASYQFEYGDDNAFHASSEVLIEAFCRQHGVAVTREHPQLQVPPATLATVRRRLEQQGISGRPLITIHLGPSWPVRVWPQESWVALTQKLHERGYHTIVRSGTSSYLPIGKVEAVPIPNVHSLVDQLTLEESIALIAGSDLLVGIDSGLLHIAACFRIPAVGIFGPTSPQFRFATTSSCSFVVSPVACQGCHHRFPCAHWITGCPNEICCMKEISVEMVLAACLSALKTTKPDFQNVGAVK